MRELSALGKRKQVLGLIHLLPLPGTPHYTPGNEMRALEKAVRDAQALHAGGADGGLIQTIDRVYPVGEAVDPARLAAMAMITHRVSEELPASFQIGVQILWNASRASLAVAHTCGGSFLRCNAFVGSTHSAYGVAEADPMAMLHYIRLLGAERIRLIAEIHSMHFHAREALSLARLAEYAVQCGAHAVEIAEPDPGHCRRMIDEIKTAVPSLPVILGGHTHHGNVAEMLAEADGAFVGTCFQPDGWGTYISRDRVSAYVDKVRALE